MKTLYLCLFCCPTIISNQPPRVVSAHKTLKQNPLHFNSLEFDTKDRWLYWCENASMLFSLRVYFVNTHFQPISDFVRSVQRHWLIYLIFKNFFKMTNFFCKNSWVVYVSLKVLLLEPCDIHCRYKYIINCICEWSSMLYSCTVTLYWGSECLNNCL